MEDVKDTLWKWFVQLCGLLGLGCATYVFFAELLPFVLSARKRDAWLVLGFAAEVLAFCLVSFKVVALKKWAMAAACAFFWWYFLLIAFFSLEFWYGDWVRAAPCLPFLLCALLFSYALIFKPKRWRGGF